MCVQKREVSLWIIFQVWMHVPATCEECNFSSKNACYLKQYPLNPKLSHLIHFFSNRNKQSERLKKYQLIKISIRLERKSEKVVNMYRLIISSIDKIINWYYDQLILTNMSTIDIYINDWYFHQLLIKKSIICSTKM